MRRALIVAEVAMCAGAVAHAQTDLSPLQRPSRPTIEAAQTHYLSGTRFFETGQYDAALVEFEAAFVLSQEPDLIFNVAKSFEREGSIKEALGAYAPLPCTKTRP